VDDEEEAGPLELVPGAQPRQFVVAPPAGGSPTIPRRWGRRPDLGDRGADAPKCGPPPAEVAGHAQAMDVVGDVPLTPRVRGWQGRRRPRRQARESPMFGVGN
jgi:hypothetical protein